MSVRKALALVATVFAAAVGTASAQSPAYSMMSPPQPTEGGGKVEVIEFFWYGCPHCYHLEPALNDWLKTAPKDVVFKRIPAAPSESWGQAATIFYTLEAMGVLEQYHRKVFDAIHKDNQNLMNKKIRDEWLAKNGIDPKRYDDVEKSFTVQTKVNRAKQLTQAYKIDSVPRFVVNGKYYTSPEMAGGDHVFVVINELIAKARAEGGATATAASATSPRK